MQIQCTRGVIQKYVKIGKLRYRIINVDTMYTCGNTDICKNRKTKIQKH